MARPLSDSTSPDGNGGGSKLPERRERHQPCLSSEGGGGGGGVVGYEDAWGSLGNCEAGDKR